MLGVASVAVALRTAADQEARTLDRALTRDVVIAMGSGSTAAP
jgi:hypothetical protein